MRRTIALLTMAALLAIAIVPLGLVAPQSARAESVMTVQTFERGSGAPALYACYTVSNEGAGGGEDVGCDGAAGDIADGTVTITKDDPCTDCRISQSFPDDPDNQPTIYLVEQDQFGTFSKTYTFESFLKPYFVVSALDSLTGNQIKGFCISVAPPGGGAVAGGCDGDAADLDEQSNGKVQTKRVLDGDYNVTLTRVPTNYVDSDPSQLVTADPAKTGEFESVTFNVKPKPRIVIKTVDAKTGKRIKGACYGIINKTQGSGLGTHCDGVKNGLFGDQDGVKNGIVVTQQVNPDITWELDQTTAPRGYQLFKKNKTVTTVAGQDAVATFKNRPK